MNTRRLQILDAAADLALATMLDLLERELGVERQRALALASVAALTLAGGLMWWRFGPAIFMDVLTTLQGCF